MGGETVVVPAADGTPALVPPGSHCYATETDNGGATSSTVDHSSYDDAVVATQGTTLATLTITVTNTFDATPLASTGAPVTSLLQLGFAFLLVGGFLLAASRRRVRGM